MHTCLFHIHLYFYLPPSCHLFFSSLSSPAHQHNESSVCVCVCAESVASSSATSHDIRRTRTLCLFRHLGARLSRCPTSAEAATHNLLHTHTHTQYALRLARSRREQQLAISLLFSRSVACKCGECNMQRASAVDPPASVGFPFPLAHTPSSPSTNFLSVPLLCLPFGNCDAFALL